MLLTKTVPFVLFFLALHLSADTKKAAGDLIEQKLQYVTKSERTLNAMKKSTEDIKGRIRFAPHKNHRQIEYLVERLQKEHKEAEGVLSDLRVAPENEWSASKPTLDTLLTDMSKDEKEAKGLLK